MEFMLHLKQGAMGLIKDFKIGLRAFFDAMGFIRQNKLTHFFIYPLVLSILFWIGGLNLIGELVNWVSDAAYGRFDIEPTEVETGTFSFLWEMWETLKGWYNEGYIVILALMIRLVMWLVMLIFSKYLLLAILSPVLALLSERAEEIQTGRKYPFSIPQLIKDSFRGIMVAMRNFFAELIMLILLWVITLMMPLLAPISAFLSLLIGSFYYGFSMIDYINERKKMSMSDGFSYIRGRRGLAIALGLGIALGMSIPGIGFIIASFVSILGAVAAVIATEEKKPEETLNYKSSIERIES